MADIDQFMKYLLRFTHEKVVHKDDIIKMGRDVYLVPGTVRIVMQKCKSRPIFAGTLLATEWRDEFKPSSQLLDLLAKTDAKRVVVNPKAEWLCVCGRPPLLTSVVEKKGNPGQGDVVLIQNMEKETIGYGVMNDRWEKKHGIITLQYDIGDFLRRERKVTRGRRPLRR